MPATQNSVRLFARWEKAVMVGPEGTVVNLLAGEMAGEQGEGRLGLLSHTCIKEDTINASSVISVYSPSVGFEYFREE